VKAKVLLKKEADTTLSHSPLKLFSSPQLSKEVKTFKWGKYNKSTSL